MTLQHIRKPHRHPTGPEPLVTHVLDQPYDRQNVFAAILAGSAPAHRIFENDTVLAFLDIAPQGPGHTLVIPKSGVTNLFDITPDDLGSLLQAIQQVGRMLVAALAADGLEIQQLNGAAAGQTVFHLHFHLIPRFDGVPIIPHAEAKVADQADLAAMAARILKGADLARDT
jgi:histidine triad (HIT) family protein